MTTPLTRVVILHGYGASPSSHWFPWLAEQLRGRGVASEIVALPDSEQPDRKAWADTLRDSVPTVTESTGIVAHSLGCLAVLRHLQALDTPWRLGRLVAVSGFVDTLPALPQLDDFIHGDSATDRVVSRVDRITVLRSDADPLVPVEHTDRLSGLLATTPVVVAGAGHFLADDGVIRLPHVLEALCAA